MSVIGYLLSVYVQCGFKSDARFFNNCLVEKLQETACGGSVLSTGCRRSSEFLQLSLWKFLRNLL